MTTKQALLSAGVRANLVLAASETDKAMFLEMLERLREKRWRGDRILEWFVWMETTGKCTLDNPGARRAWLTEHWLSDRDANSHPPNHKKDQPGYLRPYKPEPCGPPATVQEMRAAVESIQHPGLRDAVLKARAKPERSEA